MALNRLAAAFFPSLLLSGCAALPMFLHPEISPERVQVPLSLGGQLQEMKLTLPLCTTLYPTIYFPRSALRDADVIRRVGAAGSGWRRDPGAPIRMRILFDRENPSGSGRYELAWREIETTQAVVEHWRADEVGREFGAVRLPRGRYRARAEIVDPVKLLADVPASLELWSTFKEDPTGEGC